MFGAKIWTFNYYYFLLQDKTFGLKNKKGAKQQKFIKTVVHQVKSGPTGLKVSTRGSLLVEQANCIKLILGLQTHLPYICADY